MPAATTPGFNNPNQLTGTPTPTQYKKISAKELQQIWKDAGYGPLKSMSEFFDRMGDFTAAGGQKGKGGLGWTHLAVPLDPQAPVGPLGDGGGAATGGGGAPFRGFGSGGTFAGGGGGAQAGHATASLATPEYINTNDPIYQLTAPKPWMSGMLARGREYTSSATEDAIRMMGDNATRQGVSMSSPAYAYMVAMQRRQQQQSLANALRDANLAWTLPAADRRDRALGQNAQMGTNVSQSNAGNLTQVSLGNAGFDTQASMANAGFSAEAARQSAALGQQAWMFSTSFAADERQRQIDNLIRTVNLPGSGDPGFQGASGADYAISGFTGALQGYQLGQGLNNLRGGSGGYNNVNAPGYFGGYNPSSTGPY